MMLVRPSRLIAVMRYEMRSHMTGRPALKLLGVAAMLMLPAGFLPTPKLRATEPPPVVAGQPGSNADTAGPPVPAKIRVRGRIPASLESHFTPSERSSVELRGSNPVTVVTGDVPTELRAALETLSGPVRLEYRTIVLPLRLPGRSLLIALLAISLLTGPLADALPGERARRTLEVLLSAGITRGELVGGKWLAWTASATGTAAVAAALACWRGVQLPGWWLFGLPLFIGSTVAFGLWLVRLVDDVVGGSAAPMRVLPVAAGIMAAIAYAVDKVSPVAAAAVPIGGPLLVAADIFSSGTQLLAASAGTGLFVVAILTRTGHDLDRVDLTSSPTRWGAVGLSAVATVMWWLAVGGPAVWAGGPAGAASSLVTPIRQSMMVGGIALLACALVAIARESQRAPAPPRAARNWPNTVLVTLAVASVLAASGPLQVLELGAARPTVDAMLDRLREAALPTTMITGGAALIAGLASITGQAVMFRYVVTVRLGWWIAGLLWCVTVCPWSPWSALPASLALGALAASQGWIAALVAQLVWAMAAPQMDAGAPTALALQTMALAISLTALRFARGVPIRHQL